MGIFKNLFSKSNAASENACDNKAIRLERERKKVNQFYDDENFGNLDRTSDLAFQNLRLSWTADIINIIPNDDKHTSIAEIVKKANESYSVGNYETALKNYNLAIEQKQELYEGLFYYMRRCEKVLSVALLSHETAIDKNLKKINYDLYKMEDLLVRCKWCGRYTEFIDPNKSTFGLFVDSNCCEHCRRMYPSPSLVWDSPAGRAYSYFRKSFFDDKEFYSEFENDYAPQDG